MRHISVDPPPFFHRGPSPLTRLAFFGLLSLALLFADTRFRYLENIRQIMAIVLYPLTAFRAMNKAALKAYETVRKAGTQKPMLPEMQTREDLYDVIGYHDYEKKLDELFARGRS